MQLTYSDLMREERELARRREMRREYTDYMVRAPKAF